MENKNRKTFFMFLMAFLIAFFIVSFVEVLRSSLSSSGAPEIPAASALEGTTPGSFSDLAERVKPAVVNISTTKTYKGRSLGNPFGRSPFHDYFGDDFFNRFFGDIPQHDLKQRSLGSGFIIFLAVRYFYQYFISIFHNVIVGENVSVIAYYKT